MPDKQDARSISFALPGWQVLEAHGVDAASFLQAQTMNDLRPLAPGHWQWNGWLNPKGRLIALFLLAALDAQRYWLVSPDVQAAELGSRLQRFVFRSKVKLAVRADLHARGSFADASPATGARLHRQSLGDSEALAFDLGGAGGARTLRIVAGTGAGDDRIADDHINHVAEPDTGTCGLRRWAAFDLAHGLPRLPADQVEAWTPQMLSLERLHAFSLKKGCYPGQEIVARTHFLGQAKRALARIQGEGLTAGAEVVAGERTLGSVVNAADGEALAVLAVERTADGWMCNGAPCRELPLLDGLAR
ncbi:MAG: folate-binding protein YgfZ [Proteobacteria bacterium]|nr:folate-binding protein YgfZ [Pseudomonadota bacterium]